MNYEWVLLLIGIVIVSILYETVPKAGGFLLLLIVLALLLTATRQKLI